MLDDPIRCPICAATPVPTVVGGDAASVDCPNCGLFSISGTAVAVLPALIGTDKRKATLVSYTLRQMQRTKQRPLLTSEGIQKILATRKLPTPDVQADNLIRWFGDHTTPGKMQTISPATHGAIVGFTDTDGIHLVLGGLQDANLIKWYSVSGPKQHVELSMAGWVRYKALSANAAPAHRLTAILSTDVAGSTTLMAADEQGTLSALRASTSMLQETVERHGGRLIKTTGDGTLSEFESTLGAMQAALEIQSAMVRQNAGRAEDKLVLLRIGLVVGDVSPDGDDIMGDSVNLAARLQSAADPGTIYTTEHVRDDLANKIALASMDLGQMPLKGIGRPVRVVKITPPY